MSPRRETGEPRALRPPLLCRALVRVASWIAPARARADWRARWDASLWNWWVLFERGELTARDQAELIRYSWGSFRDAFWLRISPEQLRHTVRSAGFIMACAGLAIALLGAATGAFSETRSLFRPLPVENPEDLVSIKYTGMANEPYGVPPVWPAFWRDRPKLLDGVAGYVHPAEGRRAAVTADFFKVLGVRPAAGRFFGTGERDAAVLSAAAARVRFGGAQNAIGQSISLGDRRYTAVGVLPEGFWAISPAIDAFTPLTLDPVPDPDTPFLVGAVGRLKPRATADALRSELFKLAKTLPKAPPRPPQVVSFSAIPSGPGGYLVWIGFGMAIGAVLVKLSGPLPSGRGWRYWCFLGAKAASVILLPALFWIEVSRRLHLPDNSPGVLVTNALPAVIFLLACACGLLWSFADQRRRCPVCLQKLTMPVSMGSWSSVLEPATTEFLCDSGHGSMCLPDAVEGAPDRWTEMDRSWSELFGKRI